ncbi:MAG: flagellar biosynthesis protein FlhB [Bacillota bacterium]|nr:flagellar biosynthesis protein FlhB [Bacillota bacterium]
MLDKINLQLFAQEKTEKATPKKRQEARRKGQVPKSQEINSALILLGCFILLNFYLPYMFTSMQQFTVKTFAITNMSFSVQETYNVFMDLLILSIKLALPIMITSMIIGMTASYMQVGFLLTGEPLKLKLERLNPIQGFKKIFSKKSLVELVKSILKIVAIGFIAYSSINSEIYIFPQLLDMGLFPTLQFLGKIIFSMSWKIGLFLLFLAIFDLVYQRWEHEQSIKMSKHDLKEEYKQTEGNPQIKGKIKEKQRQMAMSRMMQDIPKASVVITNPTHLAIALHYEEGMAAPKVLAKGQDRVAEKIKEIANQHQIPIMENKPLARALFLIEIGQQIPEELFQTVAEVLAFVYKLKNKQSKK